MHGHPAEQSASELHDVLIAGAGPVGLFLACELRLAGISVLVLEQNDDPHSPLKRLPFGMRGLTTPTLEALYRRDLLDAVAAAGHANDASGATRAAAHWMQQPRRPAGHFAGIPFFHDDVDTARWLYRLPSPAGTGLAVDIESLESVLAARACTLGVEVRRGRGVEAIDLMEDGVTVRACGDTFRGRWLVGCDGGRSTVRKACGFDFIGTDPEFTGYSIEVEIADPNPLRSGRTYTPEGMYTFAPPGTISVVDFDGGAFHRSSAVTLDHLQAVLRRISGTDVRLTDLRLATTWTDRAYQAATYRRGAVLLAGDAAHVHSPLGGQGLNLGLGDAMNLGWKLAATIRGEAPADLLDSYQDERHRVAADVLDLSRAQVALMRPTPSTRALAAVVRDLVGTHDGATYFAGRLWGVALRYDLGGGHPLTGHSAPDLDLGDGRKLGALLRSGRGLLLDLSAERPLQALAGRWHDRVLYVAGDARERLGLDALLVRPDGFVAWASDGAPDIEEAAAAAARWFGRAGAGEDA